MCDMFYESSWRDYDLAVVIFDQMRGTNCIVGDRSRERIRFVFTEIVFGVTSRGYAFFFFFFTKQPLTDSWMQQRRVEETR